MDMLYLLVIFPDTEVSSFVRNIVKQTKRISFQDTYNNKTKRRTETGSERVLLEKARTRIFVSSGLRSANIEDSESSDLFVWR